MHKSFHRKNGLTQKDILENQEFFRMETKAIIRNELNDEQVVNLSEAAVITPLGMSWTIVSMIVWFRA